MADFETTKKEILARLTPKRRRVYVPPSQQQATTKPKAKAKSE